MGLTFGTVIGIPLLINIYGLPAAFAGLLSLGSTVYGFINHKKLIGQIMAVIGVVSWILLGIFGLGHGG